MKSKRYLLISILLIVLFLLCILASLSFGSKTIGFHDVLDALKNPASTQFSALVVWQRVPRTIFALMAGSALGIAGSLMQSITRNPIADPSILGINTGASLFVVCGIAFLQITTYQEYIWLALLGSALSAMVVYGVASMGISGATPMKLALSGALMSVVLSSMISVVMLPRSQVMNTFRFWQVGSVSGANWESIFAILPFLIVGIVLAFAIAYSLNALALGEEMAITLGVKTRKVRLLGAASSVLLCGSVTAIAGPIGFVGLMIPHMMRFLLGPDIRMNILMSAFGGAILLCFADVVGRLLGSPGELEVGIITAFIGAPILIMIAMKAKVRSL